MEHKLSRKYGLFTAIAMVVGIVIGSGVFFKAQTILEKTGGDVKLGILAWLLGGAIMMACILAFAIMAARYAHISGIVDYAEATVGTAYAYFVGWFLSAIYYPTLVSVLAWLSARYTLVFVNTLHPAFAASPDTGPGVYGGRALFSGHELYGQRAFSKACRTLSGIDDDHQANSTAVDGNRRLGLRFVSWDHGAEFSVFAGGNCRGRSSAVCRRGLGSFCL